MSITLRSDDWKTLEYIQRISGLGILRALHPSPSQSDNTKPTAKWTISTIDECLEFIVNIDGHGGLVAKKRRDYEIWKEAVRLLDVYGGGKHSKVRHQLDGLKKSIEIVRTFDPNLTDGLSDLAGRNRDGNVSDAKTGRSSSEFWANGSLRSTAARRERQVRYAKLTQEQVDDIVARIESGQESRTDIAADYNVSVGLLSKFATGKYLRRDGTLTQAEQKHRMKPTEPGFWETEAGIAAKARVAAKRSKISQDKIDELVARYQSGEATMNTLAKEYGISRPLVSRFINGNYVRRT